MWPLGERKKAVNEITMDILQKADEISKGAITNIVKDLSVLQMYSR